MPPESSLRSTPSSIPAISRRFEPRGAPSACRERCTTTPTRSPTSRARVIELAQRHGGAVTLAQLRDELGTSRKFAQALLEHLDAEKVTIRRGDLHHLRAVARGLRAAQGP